MTAPGDLAGLLASGEHAAFHGQPSAAVGVLEQAVVLAQSQNQVAEVAAGAWLLGVALAAGGRYGGALTVLAPLVESGLESGPASGRAADAASHAESGVEAGAMPGRAAGTAPERRLFGALAGATIASVHRQLGRHAVAREADLAALALAGSSAEAGFDALLGLASDAVGLDDADEAARRLAEAGSLVSALAPARRDEWWRQQVRLGWVSAELAMLEGRVDEATVLAAEAVDRAERARAPRHVAKGLLILGLAQLSGGDDGPGDEAAQTLRRAATLAESLGTLPLVWPSRALLGALLVDSDAGESDRSLAAARAAIVAIAGDLPPGVRAEWLARADVAALLEA